MPSKHTPHDLSSQAATFMFDLDYKQHISSYIIICDTHCKWSHAASAILSHGLYRHLLAKETPSRLWMQSITDPTAYLC